MKGPIEMDATILPVNGAADAIRRNCIPVLRRLSVEETEQVVTLSGYVGSYYHKQLAQETIVPFLNGRELINRIVVRRPSVS